MNVALAMRDAGSTIGGEGNGGVILPELHLGRDAPVAVALVLHLLRDHRQAGLRLRHGASALRDREGQARPAGCAARLRCMRRCSARFPDATADTQDGLRLDWPDRWVHLRPSGTEPIVRVIAEAPSELAARQLVADAREPLSQLVGAS